MSKEKFNWKSLFVQETEGAKQESAPIVENKVSTPEAKTTFPTTTNIGMNDGIQNEVLGKVIEMYEKGFDSLNQSGYDFYEFFKAVMATDPNNPQSYIMAYTMANSMDKSVTKTSLLSSADFYVKEIHKVHTQYEAEGNKIKNDFINTKKSEKEKLQSEIKTIQNKLIVLQNELEQKNSILQNFDNSNFGKIAEIEQKLMANNLSKERLVQKLSQVISGINNNI